MASTTIDQIALDLTANSSKAEKVVDELINSTERLKRTFQSLATVSDRTGRSLSGISRLSRDAAQAAQSQDRLQQSTARTAAAQARAVTAQERLRQATINTATAQERLNAATARTATAQERLKQSALGTEAAQARSAATQERLRAATASAEAAQTRSATAQKRLQQATIGTATAQEKLQQATANTQAAQARAAAAQERLTQAQMRTSQLAERQAASVQKASGILGGLKFAAIAGGMNIVGNAIGEFVTRSNAYVENLNLFAAQMGEFRGQADAFVSQLEEVLGVDPSEAMQYMGFFMQLTQSMGVASDKAYIMSKNLTQLGYDISSFVNIGIEDAMLKLQSGLAGEIEPLRRIGYALTETQMQTYLDKYSAAARSASSATRDMTNSMYENGNAAILNANYIGAKVRSLNDAQKEELRYVMILDQSVRAQGDMARTLNSPANQLRIFRQELNMVARAIGNVFIPLLNAIIPVAIAVAQVIREVMNAIAAFFGFTIPEVDYSGFSAGANDAAAGVGNLGDGLDGTTGKAKKAQKALNDLLGPMDELHILNQDMGDSGGGGGGAGGGGGGGIGGGGLGLFDKLPEYNMFKDAIANQVDAIKKKLKELLPVIAAITTALLAWKIGKKIFKNLDAIKAAMSALGMVNVAHPWKVLLGWLAVVAGELVFLTGFYDSLFNTASLGSFTKMLAGAAVVAGVLSKVLGKTKLSFISLATNGILMATAGLKDFLTGNYSVWSAVEAITGIAIAFRALNKISPSMSKWGAPITLLASGLLGVYAASKNLAQGDASLPVLAVSIASVGASGLGAYKVVTSLATIFPVLGSAAVPIAGIIAAATAGFLAFKYATSDALQPVDLFAGKLEVTDEKLRELGFTTVEVGEKTKEAVGKFLEAWNVLDQQTIAVDWSGLAPSQEQLSEITASLSKVSQTLVDSTEDMRTKSTEALDGVREALGDSYDSILAKTNEYYDTSKSDIKKQSDEIMKIYENAYNEERGLTETEAARIEEIKQKWRTTGVQNLSESALESQIILQNLRDNEGQLTAEAAAEAIKNAKKQKKETIKEAEEQYQQILLEAEKMHQVGAINDEEYAQIRQAATETKESQIQAANEAYTNIKNTAKEQMGEMGKYFDTETGEMKSKWSTFVIDFKETFASVPTEFKKSITDIKNWIFGTSDDIETDVRATSSAVETVAGNTAAVIMQKFGVASAETKKALEEITAKAKEMFDTTGTAATKSMEIAKNAISGASGKAKTEFKEAETEVGKSFDNMHQKASSTAKNIPPEFTNVHTAISNAISWTQVGKIGENISKGIFEGMKKSLNLLAARYSAQMVQNLTRSFVIHSPSQLTRDEVGIYVGEGIGEGMVIGVSKYLGQVTSIVTDISDTSKEIASEMMRTFNDISYSPTIDYQALINAAEEAGDLASAALYEKIRNAKIEDMGLDYEQTYKYSDSLSEQMSENSEGISQLHALLESEKELSTAYQTADLATGNQISESLTGFHESLKEVWEEFKSIFTETSQSFVELLTTNHANLTNFLNSQFARTVDAVNNIRINIYNNYYSNGFASGGFPSMGDMFVANEAGAELIGSINGKTAVVNNDQIVAAVSQGVASAVAEVMQSAQERPINVNTYLDGKQIYTNQQKVKKEMGVDFDLGVFTR